MTEHISSENLSAYLDNALNDLERRQLERHLPRCAPCNKKFEEFARLAELLRHRKALPVPPFFAERLSATIRARRRERGFAADFAWVAKRLTPAFAIFLAAVFAWTFWKPSDRVMSLDNYLSPADSTAVIALLVQNETELTTDDVLQLAVFEPSR